MYNNKKEIVIAIITIITVITIVTIYIYNNSEARIGSGTQEGAISWDTFESLIAPELVVADALLLHARLRAK